MISSSNKSRVDAAVATLQKSYPSQTSRISGHVCDLSDKDKADANIKNLFEQTGKLNHVVFTASDALPIVPLQDMTVDAIQKAGQIRFNAALLVGKHAANFLVGGSNSSITFTGGVLAEKPMPSWSLITGYSAGLQGITRALAIELKPIRVNIVQPGTTTGTNLFASSGIPDQVKEGLIADMSQRLPVQKVGTPEDLAEAYLYLLKDRNVTGEIVNSSGGLLMI